MKYTITVLTENKPGVLNRISDLLLRRKINIESLTVSETEQDGISRFTILIKGEELLVEKVVKQLYKVIEVTKVYESLDSDIVFKEIALFKVASENGDKRREIGDIANMVGGKIVHLNPTEVFIEKTGTEEEINNVFVILKPYGIKSFVRSGRIALRK